jgi:Polyketide cyclase / dehydrase and lipid transport
VAVLTLSQVIDRAVPDVFEAIVDVGSFPRWNPTTKSVRKLSAGQAGEGTTFELAIRGFGRTNQELRGFERDRRVTLVPHITALSGGHTFILAPEGDGRTRVDHELEMSPRGAWKVLGPLVALVGRRNLRQTASALKHWLEHPRRD